MEFKREYLPIGGDEEVPVIIGSEDGGPSTVFMSYESYLEVATTLLLALGALRKQGALDDADRPRSRPQEGEENVVDLDLVREARRFIG